MRSPVVFFFILMALSPAANAQWLRGVSQLPVTRYDLKLESTVGVGNSCESDKLSLPAGVHELTVCLLATNAGDGNLVVHELISEQLGTLIYGDYLTLGPGESAYYSYSVLVSQSVGLVSRWTGFSEFGQSACAIAWSVVVIGQDILNIGPTDPQNTLLCYP